MSVCPICCEQFETYDKRKKYCSTECARNSHLDRTKQMTADKRKQQRQETQYKCASAIVHRVIATHKIKTIDELVGDLLDKYYFREYNKKK